MVTYRLNYVPLNAFWAPNPTRDLDLAYAMIKQLILRNRISDTGSYELLFYFIFCKFFSGNFLIYIRFILLISYSIFFNMSFNIVPVYNVS